MKVVQFYTAKSMIAGELTNYSTAINSKVSYDLSLLKQIYIAMNDHSQRIEHDLTDENIALQLCIIATRNPLYQAKDAIFNKLLLVINSDVIALRQKAIKSVQDIVSVESSLMKSASVFGPIKGRLLDASISVRDAAVDLIWKVMSESYDTDFIKQYYYILSDRILVCPIQK